MRRTRCARGDVFDPPEWAAPLSTAREAARPRTGVSAFDPVGEDICSRFAPTLLWRVGREVRCVPKGLW